MNDEKADNKATLMLFGVLFFLTAIGEVVGLYGIGTDNNYLNIGLSIVRLVGIITIVQSGTILKAKPFIQIIYFLIAIIIIGALFKIQHWPYGNLLVTCGLIAISILYLVRFLNKTDKSLLDVTKLLWFVSFCISAVFKINHWLWGNELLDMQTILFLVLLFSFLHKIMQTLKQRAEST